MTTVTLIVIVGAYAFIEIIIDTRATLDGSVHELEAISHVRLGSEVDAEKVLVVIQVW